MTYQEVVNNQINNIMDSFDFRKVESVMKYLDWKWWGVESTPSEYELRKKARQLLESAVNNKCNVGSGGFSVEYSTGTSYELNNGVETEMPWVRINLAFSVNQTINDGEYYDEN